VSLCICIYVTEKLKLQYRAAALNLGSMDPMGVHENLQRSLNLDGENIPTLLSLTSYWNLAVHSLKNIGNKVIYGLWTPKISLPLFCAFKHIFLRTGLVKPTVFTRLSNVFLAQQGEEPSVYDKIYTLYEICTLLRYYSVYCGNSLPMFRDNLVPKRRPVITIFKGQEILTIEDGPDRLPRNFDKLLALCAA